MRQPFPHLRLPDQIGSPEIQLQAGRFRASRLGGVSIRIVLPLALVAAAFAVAGGLRFFGPGDTAPLDDLHREALELIEQHDDLAAIRKARSIARELKELGYRNAEFAGGVDLILGLGAYYEAASTPGGETDHVYRQAAGHLLEAERQALDEARRPQWSFALGISLERIGRPTDARARLVEAIQTWPPGRVEAALRLAEIALELNEPEQSAAALTQIEAVLDADNAYPPGTAQLVEAYLLGAGLLLAVDRPNDVEAFLDRLGNEERVDQAQVPADALVVLQARVRLARGERSDLTAAAGMLKPVSQQTGLQQTIPRQAMYLSGRCAERLGLLEAAAGRDDLAAGHFDTAVNHYVQTAKRFAQSHEGVAARLRAAELLRKAGRTEEALEAYRQALAPFARGEDFRNRWLGRVDFREAVLNAWDDWLDDDQYAAAIALSGQITSLLEPLAALELEARANERWSAHLDARLEEAAWNQRSALSNAVRKQWRASGRAWERLAEQLMTTARYGETLWTSAEHYYRGHDFVAARRQLERFIDTQPRQRLPLALVRLGRVLLDLDRPEEAGVWLQRVVAEHPTDIAAIEARFLVGEAHFEAGDLDAAEAQWRGILAAGELTPAALEWQQALFALGRLLFQRGVAASRRAAATALVDDVAAQRQLQLQAFSRWDEAVLRLDEFVRRYPESEHAVEARLLLARALVHRSERARFKLGAAETENSRLDLLREMRSDLNRAAGGLIELRNALTATMGATGLSPLDERILRDSYFEIAHALSALGDDREAIAHYSTAANRYPRDPRVLSAYLQMAKCNERLGRPAETRSMLEQARVILDSLPAEVFESRLTGLSRDEWAAWIDWSQQTLRLDSAGPPAS